MWVSMQTPESTLSLIMIVSSSFEESLLLGIATSSMQGTCVAGLVVFSDYSCSRARLFWHFSSDSASIALI